MTTQATQPLTLATPGAKVLPDRWRHRIIAAVVFLPCVAVLGVAMWLTPDAHGAGTHTQLGLAPCQLYLRTAMPCPTCGMTTAVTYAAHGHLLDAIRIQPAGALFAVAVTAMAMITGIAMITGAKITPLLLALTNPKVIIAIGATIVAAWAYKTIILTEVLL